MKLLAIVAVFMLAGCSSVSLTASCSQGMMVLEAKAWRASPESALAVAQQHLRCDKGD